MRQYEADRCRYEQEMKQKHYYEMQRQIMMGYPPNIYPSPFFGPKHDLSPSDPGVKTSKSKKHLLLLEN